MLDRVLRLASVPSRSPWSSRGEALRRRWGPRAPCFEPPPELPLSRGSGSERVLREELMRPSSGAADGSRRRAERTSGSSGRAGDRTLHEIEPVLRRSSACARGSHERRRRPARALPKVGESRPGRRLFVGHALEHLRLLGRGIGVAVGRSEVQHLGRDRRPRGDPGWRPPPLDLRSLSSISSRSRLAPFSTHAVDQYQTHLLLKLYFSLA